MTQAEARRRLEATTDFVIRDGCVWLREVAWLRAVEEIRRATPVPVPGMPGPAVSATAVR